MTDTTRSRSEVLKEGIVAAIHEAGALLLLGERGARVATSLEAARKLAAELKMLSQRMGSEEGYKDAVQMLASIEQLQAQLRPGTDSKG